jgi:three-Cys-motif partner protein
MQVEWETLERIANTKAIDLWLLFPIGQAVNRMLTKGQLPPVQWGEALTRTFGTDEWEIAFYETNAQMNLLLESEEQIAKVATFASIAAFFTNRLKTIFSGVAPNPLFLLNSKNVPIYLLCFASASPTGSKIAVRIAQHILKS